MMNRHSNSMQQGAGKRGKRGKRDGRDGAIGRACAGSARAGRARGFSLLELLIALGLMIALMGGIYGFYVTTMKARDTATQSMRDTLQMRALLEQMAEEIRHITDVVPDNIGFSGTEEEITFVRLSIPDMGVAYGDYDSLSTDPKPGQQDMMRVTYKLQWDEEEENLDEDGTAVCYGMLRSQQAPIDPNPSFTISAEEAAKYEEESGFTLGDEEEAPPPVSAELIAPEIKYLRFEYFDGAQWRYRWQSAVQEADQEGLGGEGGGDTGGSGGGGSGGGGGGGGLDGGGGGGGAGGRGDAGGGGAGGGGAGGGAGLGTGSLTGGSALGGMAGGQAGAGEDTYVLPQAIRITVGKTKVPRPPGGYEPSQLEEERELNLKTHYPDRWTMTVYLRQADQSQLSSRKYGIDNDISGEDPQMGEQTEGGGR